ncbi:SDR family NAD(P)-dependent oxidoreductase [Paenibacillus sp. UMB4589-SE434]|uniref:SDR family NAD(P)-dependent oxidoreductase n=1 Tax=Paenibacillus sp. UMB4589-SE434 TaxID=3046314 RepID=UPI00254AAA31|nr:SDR family NAD(P)-dependent oxidoreductase [Paenibacillus sp. UMB4589-SE434]MDK8180300.1 SDR family NAD(P)-dependent oxidoreductase [Paenibacillus sp. UMB4589-SE434]
MKDYKFGIVIRNEDYIMRDHRVHQTRIMPGVTFLDTLYRFIQSKQPSAEGIELRHILFKEPIATSEYYDKKIEITLMWKHDHWKVNARSCKMQGEHLLEADWSINFECELHIKNIVPVKALPLYSLKQEAVRQSDLDQMYSIARRLDIHHYEFMKGLGEVYIGKDYALAEVHLSEIAGQYSDYFILHPAFLDCSTLVSGVFNGEQLNFDAAVEEELKPFIPMYIESVHLSGRLGTRCYVYVKREIVAAPSGPDIQHSNYDIYNEDGERVASFKKLSSKRVRKKSLIVGLTQLDEPPGEARERMHVSEPLPVPAVRDFTTSDSKSAQETIAQDLKRLIAGILRKSDQNVDVEAGFYDQGLDSMDLLNMVQILEQRIGESLYPTLLFEYSTVEALSEYLADRYASKYETAVQAGHDEAIVAPSTPDPVGSEQQSVSVNQKGYYVPGWNIQPLLEEKTMKYSRVLVFAADARQLEMMRQSLQRWSEGQIRIYGVVPGISFKEHQSGDDYTINPLVEHDYRSLIEAVMGTEAEPLHILHAWSNERFSESDNAIRKQLDQGIHSVFLLSRALMDYKPKDSINLLYVYGDSDEEIQPLYAAVDGFAKSIYVENPKFIYKTLIVDRMMEYKWVKDIVREWMFGDHVPLALRHRSGVRQVRGLQQAALKENRGNDEGSAEAVRPILRKNGVYWITGGLGGIGFIVARHLAVKVQAKLVLTGRSQLNGQKLDQIRELERHGAEVLYLESDIGRPGEAKRVVVAASKHFGVIHGVIHSAGVLRDGYVFQKQLEDMDEVLRSKVWGTIYLNQALRDQKPEFMLLFSSLAAVTGNGGQSDYAFANSFMDYYAARMEQQRRSQSDDHPFFRAVNWPLWQEGGMKVDAAHAVWMRSKTGIEPLCTSFGLEALEVIFELTDAQSLVVEGDQQQIMRTLGILDDADVRDISIDAADLAKSANTGDASGKQLFVSDGIPEEGIAIIGLSGRYPMAQDVEQYWRNLRDGVDCIREIPQERWDHREYYNPDKDIHGTSYSKWGGFIEDVDKFDPLFFNISPREAHWMDPQERLFLETVWETIEDAGYAKSSLNGRRVGIFVGSMWGQYQLLATELGGRKVSPMSIHASIANRISFFFNFTGPSMALDTMCSSSLMAIYLACESIARGECQEAIAGGVNISIHPNKYTSLSQARFFSSDGKCRSFGVGGDGYVPGEGVGAVLLKSLRQAEADGDKIYGVIKGISVNHGGRTGGYSVPNPQAQADVIAEALRKANIDPSTITYIEAHGTGTSLGDPIEIAGLAKAFESVNKKQFCAIGSAKSNIGHLESAAGIAGVTKVLLQMKYGQLAPSLHAEELNPNIHFAATPFYVQRKLEKWTRPVLRDGNDDQVLPLRAGVSSFGAGGANVHIVIEEYRTKAAAVDRQMAFGPDYPAIIILSAKNKVRLQAQAQRLLHFIKSEAAAETHVSDIAYTLQVGRESMEERIGLLAGSIWELEEKLVAFINGQRIFEQGKGDIKGYKLLELWLKGQRVDWSELYRDNPRPQKVSLPAYPFARERYWLPETHSAPDQAVARTKSDDAYIHPLLHLNTSNLSEIRFTTVFTGQEFFILDHIVQGRPMLPGVVYLEMARAAVETAAVPPRDGLTAITLKNVFWVNPLVVQNEQVRAHVRLYPDDEGEIHFEIYGSVKNEDTVYCQGYAVLHQAESMSHLPLSTIKGQCDQGQLTAKACYEAFAEVGLCYGEGQQGIEVLYVGQGQVLAKLSLPPSLTNTHDAYVLHPSLMDSALQATIGLFTGFAADRLDSGQTALPFALHEAHVFGPCTPTMWAWVRYSKDSSGFVGTPKLDIDVCDEIGNVRVRINGFSTRPLSGGIQEKTDGQLVSGSTNWNTHIGQVLLAPVWDVYPLEQGETFPERKDRIVIVGGSESIRSELRNYYPYVQTLDILGDHTVNDMIQDFGKLGEIDHLIWIAPHEALPSITGDAAATGQEQPVLHLLRFLKCLLELGYGSKELGLTVLTVQAYSVHKHDSVNPAHAALHGLIGSAANEYKHWHIRLVDLDAAEQWPLAEIFTCAVHPQGQSLVYRSKEWYRQELIPFEQYSANPTLYRAGGVYVVIGGAGGIGEAWSEYMIRTYKANIVWVGRREKDAAIVAKLDRLAALGPIPEYVSADASNPQELDQAYQSIKRRHGQIHGVIHSAIHLLDKSLAAMDEERFRAGLSAKIGVSEALAQVFQREPLDFVLFFSSINAFLKAPGQSNYVAGCTYKDAFAHQLALEWPCMVKVMNWGYWGSVGAVADIYYEERMNKAGFGSIEPAEAMEALETLLAGPMDQLAFVRTTKPLEQLSVRCDEAITAY